jgi:hypothetical protein
MPFIPGQYNNAAKSTLASSMKATDTSLTLHSGDGANFPTSGPYLVAVGDAINQYERMRVTSRSGDSLAVTRNPTAASAWGSSVPVELIVEDGVGDLWGVGSVLSNITTLQSNVKLPVVTGNTAQAVTNAGTIASASLAISRVTAAGNVTGAILAAGTADGQIVIVQNSSSHSVTFDTAATSNVADGASDSIAATTAAFYEWDNTAALWFRIKAS